MILKRKLIAAYKALMFALQAVSDMSNYELIAESILL